MLLPRPSIPTYSLSPPPSSSEYIQRIMTLEESVQHVVMEAIQEVGEGIPCGSPEVSGEGTLGNWAQPLPCLVRSGLCPEVSGSRPVYVGCKSEPCSLRSIGLFLHWREPLSRSYLTKLASERSRREVPRLMCRSSEGSISQPSSSQCPLPQLMTKDTPDSLSAETYGNFDTQVMESLVLV